MSKRKILVVTDASKDIGFGHLRRSSSLAEYLQENYTCILYNIRAPASTLPTDVDLVIFDVRSDQSKMVALFRDCGVKSMGLDTCYDIPPDLTLSVFEHNPSQKGKRLSGFQFIIIRDEIRKMEKRESITHNRALVLLGGGDINNQSASVADRLLQYGYSVTLVFGPLAKVGHICENTRLTQLHQPENLPELMNDCDFAVTNGGGCLFEMLYLDKPVFILPQTKEEETIANYVASNTQVLGCGLGELHKLKDLKSSEYGGRVNTLVFGRGLENIEQQVVELLRD